MPKHEIWWEEYVNKRGEQKIRIGGLARMFDTIGIPMTYQYVNKAGLGMGEWRGNVDEGKPLVALVDAWLKEHMVDSMRATATEWWKPGDGPSNVDVMMIYQMLETTRGRIKVKSFLSCGLSGKESRLLFGFLVRDNWLDSDGSLSRFGRDQLIECVKFVESERTYRADEI